MTDKDRAPRFANKQVAWIVFAAALAFTPASKAFWPFSATEENPFAGKVFVSDPSISRFFASFNFWIFNTTDSVLEGKMSLRLEDYEGRGDRYEKALPYTVDARQRQITLGDSGFAYEFINSKTVVLRQIDRSLNLYEVPSQPQVFFRSEAYLSSEGKFGDPEHKDRLMNRRLRTLDHYIEAAKANREPPPEPPQDPPTNAVTNLTITNVTVTNNVTLTNVMVTNEGQTVIVQNGSDKEGGDSGEENKDDPTPGNPPKQLTVDDLVNGQYQGSFVNETKGTRMKFDLRIVPLCEPAGNPPKARISGVINFEDGRSDRGLQGEAVYAEKTTFTLGWNNSTGTVAYNGTLEGDNLHGSWRMDGANGEKSNGTFEAVRTGP